MVFNESYFLRARCSLLGNIPGTNIFESIETCREAQEFKHIKVIRYEESVYYTNVDNFKYQVMKFVGLNPEDILHCIDEECNKQYKKLEEVASKLKKLRKKNKPSENLNIEHYFVGRDGLIDVEENKKIIREKFKRFKLKDIVLKHIVLDCSCINYVDSQGVQAIQWLYENYKEIDISLQLSYCKSKLKYL